MAAMIGAEARRIGRRVFMGKIAMEDVSCAFKMGETGGFMKILIDADAQEIPGGLVPLPEPGSTPPVAA